MRGEPLGTAPVPGSGTRAADVALDGTDAAVDSVDAAGDGSRLVTRSAIAAPTTVTKTASGTTRSRT